jgi:hypothetical protein
LCGRVADEVVVSDVVAVADVVVVVGVVVVTGVVVVSCVVFAAGVVVFGAAVLGAVFVFSYSLYVHHVPSEDGCNLYSCTIQCCYVQYAPVHCLSYSIQHFPTPSRFSSQFHDRVLIQDEHKVFP